MRIDQKTWPLNLIAARKWDYGLASYRRSNGYRSLPRYQTGDLGTDWPARVVAPIADAF